MQVCSIMARPPLRSSYLFICGDRFFIPHFFVVFVIAVFCGRSSHYANTRSIQKYKLMRCEHLYRQKEVCIQAAEAFILYTFKFRRPCSGIICLRISRAVCVCMCNGERSQRSDDNPLKMRVIIIRHILIYLCENKTGGWKANKKNQLRFIITYIQAILYHTYKIVYKLI